MIHIHSILMQILKKSFPKCSSFYEAIVIHHTEKAIGDTSDFHGSCYFTFWEEQGELEFQFHHFWIQIFYDARNLYVY